MSTKNPNALKESRSDKIFNTFVYVILTIVLLIVAYPVYFVVIASISDPAAVARGDVILWPIGFTFEGYIGVFENGEVMRGFVNSLVYTVTGTVLSLVVTLPAAYALSRNDLRGRGWITGFFMVTMYVGGGLIPTYMLIKNMHMIDTIWAIILPGALSVYNMIIAMSFFRSSLPQEILEAARVDGCSNTKFFFKIAIPLSGAVIAILVLYYGVGLWNSYFSGLIYLTSREKWPLQLVMRTILVLSSQALENVKDIKELQRQQLIAELLKYSLIVISSVPILLIYPFIQKHFVKGVMIGSVKG